MTSCQCQAGFFVLRTCRSPAALQCSACSRFMCQEHTATGLPRPMCHDCRARGQQDSGAAWADSDLDTSPFNDAWVYGLRGRYYTGSRASSRYDARDARAFVAADREIEDLDDSQGGFGDS
jgi:hypothetical protein